MDPQHIVRTIYLARVSDFYRSLYLVAFIAKCVSLCCPRRHMQYIQMRLLHKLLPHVLSNLYRLELTSILECNLFDQFIWCQTCLQHIVDVRLRNFRIRSVNLTRFFDSLRITRLLTVFHFEHVGLTWNIDHHSLLINQAFTSLILHAEHLAELSLAYNNLDSDFMRWLCQMLLFYERQRGTQLLLSWWSIRRLNLTFNLLSGESIRRLIDTMKVYQARWQLSYGPITRIDIQGNALEMREVPFLKRQFDALGCDLTSYNLLLFVDEIVLILCSLENRQTSLSSHHISVQ
jgi:hypothetical protein